ncbi:hypothetical protein BC829DRAFT_254938 [Chytridium lagenaria]|nr:hypothetical protein BC829DRAFT_254938 [Chytridium lagenaria]
MGGSGHRIRIAHAYLKTLPPEKIVILSLAADDSEVIMMPGCTASILEHKFRKVSNAVKGAPVMVAAEMAAWPDIELMDCLMMQLGKRLQTLRVSID